MKSGRNLGTCLLCSRSNCLIETEDEEIVVCAEVTWFGVTGGGGVLEEWEVPGSENCVKSKRRAVNLFVLSKILDVPETLLERKMKNDEGLTSSIQICDDCLCTGVEKAWTIHQQLVALEETFREVKQEIKESMKERMERMKKLKRRKNGSRRGVFAGGAIPAIHEEIVKAAFRPPEMVTCNTAAATDLTDDQISSECNHHDNGHGTNTSAPDSVIHDDADDNGDFGGGGSSGCEANDNNFEPENENYISDSMSSDEEYEPRSSRRKRKPARTSKNLRGPKRKRSGLTCTICRTRNRTRDDYDAHMKAHEENEALGEHAINCPQCKFPCKTSIELDLHIHNRHVIPGRLKLYECPLCIFKSKVWKNLKLHTDTKHPNATEEELGPEVLLKCATCGFQASNPHAFHAHERDAHLVDPSSSTPLEEQQPVQCPECGILFDSKDKLNFHIIGTHKRDEKFICDTCGKGFTRKRHLDSHIITHERHQKRNFVCHICGMDYSYKFTLDDHYRKFHSSNSKKRKESSDELYKCRYCDLTSPFSNVIRRHLQVHKEQNGHRCEKCGKYYMNSQGLRRHIIINHPENEDETFQCTHCYKTYSNLNALQGHVKYHCGVKKLIDQKLALQVSSSAECQDTVPSMVASEVEFKSDF